MGFVAPSAGGEDHFVHRSFLQDGTCLIVGGMVQFDSAWDAQKNKSTARNVTGASTPGAAPTFGRIAQVAQPRPQGQAGQGQVIMPQVWQGRPQAGKGQVVHPQVMQPRVVQPHVVQPMQHQLASNFQAGFQTGTVKTWQEARGMGFIGVEGGGQDFFVHRSSLTDGTSLQEGAQVSFEGQWDAQKNKPIAKNVSGATGDATGGLM